jgi:hypothetical protein
MVLIAAALSDYHDQTVAGMETRAAAADGDIYNPWAKADGFRIGG